MIARLSVLATRPGNTRRVLIGAGIAFLVAAAFGVPVTTILKSSNTDFQNPQAENQRVNAAIEHATGQSPYYGVVALVSTPGNVLTDRAAQLRAARVAALLSTQPGFQRVLDYPATHLPALVSRDGHQAVVLAAFSSQERSAAAAARLGSRLAGQGVRFGGPQVAFNEINSRTSSDLKNAELLAFPILLLLSLWVFRGLIAAALPLLVGGFAIVLTFLALRLIDQGLGLSIFAVNLVTGMGLGLGIDYSLFVLSRFREELAVGLDSRAAIARTLQTAGRTVLYSSLTVAGALASLLVFPLRFLYSMGIGGMVVALSAGAVALIVLPAVLVALGPRVNALAPAWLQRSAARSAQASEQGGWFRLGQSVMRRPGLVALVTAAVLLAIASPALRLQLIPADAHVLPSSSQSRQITEDLDREFASNGAQTISIVLPASPGSGARVAALSLSAQRTAGAQAREVAPPHYLGSRHVGDRTAPAGNGSLGRQPAAGQAPAHARAPGGSAGGRGDGVVHRSEGRDLLPCPAVADDPRVRHARHPVPDDRVGRAAADGAADEPADRCGGRRTARADIPGRTRLLAAGLQPDRGPGGVQSRAAVHGRVRAVDRLWRVPVQPHQGDPRRRSAHREAVAQGLERTGRLITAAALLFCVAVGAFATSHIFFIKQFGVGTALAVAIDATFVRALLVPALMGRLGERTWWAPRPLRRLHARVGLRELSEPTSA